MNIYEAVEALIALQKKSISYLTDATSYKTEIAEILQKLLDSGGVGEEYKTSIINIPGVKELVEEAYKEGFKVGYETGDHDKAYPKSANAYRTIRFYKYMKALEDKDE